MLGNALTDVGLVRKENEDKYLLSLERGLFVVADGMGGHHGGGTASRLAIEVIDSEFCFSKKGGATAINLQSALNKANAVIYEKSCDERFKGMGTTVTAALVDGGFLHLAHIGDSRAYLFRHGELNQLTQDHSLVNELYQSGSLTREEAKNHPQRNVLTRALGTGIAPQIDLLTIDLQVHDYLLLCTDGLYNHVSEESMMMIIRQTVGLQDKVKMMVEQALQKGGTDNVTVVLVQYE